MLSSEIKSSKNKAEPTKIGPIFIYVKFMIVMRDYFNRVRTPNEDINQRNLKIWADVADKIPYLKSGEWEFIFGLAVKAIFSPGVRSL